MANPRICSVDGCDKPIEARGWCKPHYRRWYNHGDPLAGKTLRGESERWLREEALAYSGDDCLIWPYAKTNKGYGDGYGRTKIDGRKVIVSRFICEKVNGVPPTQRHQAAHSCGNGHLGCVTPKHLSWKTPEQNWDDRRLHGRGSWTQKEIPSGMAERAAA